jgi:hypothetical protein
MPSTLVVLLPIGSQVQKFSGNPFKSRLKINTVKGYVQHPKMNNQCYTFVEDDSYVECFRCFKVGESEQTT